MKLKHLFALSLGLTFGTSFAEAATYTGSFWTDGVSASGGWYDAEKTPAEDMDDNMCYAASASNLIAWWQNGKVGSTLTSDAPRPLEGIWKDFVSNNQMQDEGGDALSAINWWVSGVYMPKTPEEWERYYMKKDEWGGDDLPLTLPEREGYYYDQYALNQQKLSELFIDVVTEDTRVTEIDFAQLLKGGCGISLGIETASVPTDGEDDDEHVAGHAITLWGVEYGEDGKLSTIWITDSDDGAEKLVKVAVTVDEANDKIWLKDGYYGLIGYYMSGVYAFDIRETFKWSTLTMATYVNLQVNPFSGNGRAGAALLPEVIINDEFDAEDEEEEDDEEDDEGENIPGADDNDDLIPDGGDATNPDGGDDEEDEEDDEEDDEDDEDDDDETEGKRLLAGVKAAAQDGEDDSNDGAEDESEAAPEEADTPETALEAILDALDDGAMNDRDAAAVAGASTAVLGQALSGDMERQLGAIRNRAAMDNSRHDVVALDAKGASLEQPCRFFAWVNAEGNRAEQNNDGTAAGYTLSSWGATLGAGMQVDKQLTLGLAVTAMYGDLKSDGPDSLDGDMDTTYLSAFARYRSGSWSHSFIGSVGSMEADYTRHAMSYTNMGDTDGTAIGLMYELGREYALSEASIISPLFNVSYRHTVVDSYKERGTNAALNVGKQSLDTVTVALGARYASIVGQQMLNCACTFEARALAKCDFGDTQSEATVGFVDHSSRATIESAERGAMGLELGASISMPVGCGSIFADGAVELRSDYTNFNAAVGYKIQF